MRNIQVVVIGDAQTDPDQYKFCVELGSFLGRKGVTVFTGGRTGVMEAVSKGAIESGAVTVGILPSLNLNDANPYCKVVIPTGLGHSRNGITPLCGDIIIAIGGKAGTLTELGFAWIHEKPVIAVTCFGGWSKELAGKKLNNRRTGTIIGVGTMEELKIQFERVVKVFKKS